MTHRRHEAGQVMVLVAFALLALIGSAALVLVAGSIEWQKNQLQQLADEAALNAALQIRVGCTLGSATTVINAVDAFVSTQRARTGGSPVVPAGSCSAGYTGTDMFGSVTETIHYPYHAHQQQVEVILSLSLPISFGAELGQTNTTVMRRAVAQQLAGSTTAISTGALSCTGGQVRVAGSVTATAITLSSNCALYAHARLDAASNTYSDLGNISTYTAGQSWLRAGGSCAGTPTKATCSDGYEVSGPGPITCGTVGSTAFVGAAGTADAAVNPNPCAVGKAPVPVPPVSTALPPEPNTDPSAIAKLPGNVACDPNAVYPDFKVGGTKVGTAEVGTPSPAAADSGGFFHFKPSCYGYLDLGLLSGGGGGAVTNVQIGPTVGPSTSDVVATVPANCTVGDLLVVTLRSATSASNRPFTPPNASWLPAGEAFLDGTAHTQIWYLPSCGVGVKSADFRVRPVSIDAYAQMTEWAGAAASPLDRTGTLIDNTNQSNETISSTGLTLFANELAITDIGLGQQSPEVYTRDPTWSNLTNRPTVGYQSEYRLNVPTGGVSEPVKVSQSTTWSGVIATFKPSGVGGGASRAVLDPGFYYFNGSGFPGGGGLCLHGSTLLAQDVTLEFVKTAGFASGTCAAGGGASCSGSCQFGSTPCSISACPPNTLADTASGGYTWFAAPCSQLPPSVGTADPSCLGASSWCPSGDRACWNLLVWEATNTGQLAIKGAAARHWLLGSVYWPGACTDTVNGTSTIEGTLRCGSLTITAAAGAGTAVGGDYGISTALVEAILVE
ncbi:MAG: pilus assembly protein TadG-related protein [Candidatus Dormiibacterota bacterium]